MHIVLYQPEIPPNTGNIARLCAATKTELHLIKPLGFKLEDRYLKRAGLDYWPHVSLSVWDSLSDYLNVAGKHKRLVATSSRSGQSLHKTVFTIDDALLFGPETKGLPQEVLALASISIRIPIYSTVRSLNLSTAAGVVLYQALFSSGLAESMPEID